MTFEEYAASHMGRDIRLGAKNGTGFFWIGTVNVDMWNEIYDEMGKIRMTWFSNKRFDLLDSWQPVAEREVVEITPSSIENAEIVLVSGYEPGHAEVFQRGLKAMENLPIEPYKRLAAAIIKEWVEQLMVATIKWIRAEIEVLENQENSRNEANLIAARMDYRRIKNYFFSDQYAVLCPGIDGKDAIEMAFDQAMKRVAESNNYYALKIAKHEIRIYEDREDDN